MNEPIPRDVLPPAMREEPKFEPVVLPVDLRDYFAAIAVIKCIDVYLSERGTFDADRVAADAYVVADAMLAARVAHLYEAKS